MNFVSLLSFLVYWNLVSIWTEIFKVIINIGKYHIWIEKIIEMVFCNRTLTAAMTKINFLYFFWTDQIPQQCSHSKSIAFRLWEELEYLALFFNLWYTVCHQLQQQPARLPTKLRFFSLFFVYKIESFIVFWAEETQY